MTTQLPASSNPSPTAGPGSSRRDKTLAAANADLYRQRRRLKSAGSRVVNESTEKMTLLSPQLIALFGEIPAKHLSNANVPERHIRNVDGEYAAEWASVRDKMLDQIGGGFAFALLGNRGTGKTQLGVHLIVQSARLGRTCLYAKAMDFFLTVRATYKSETQTELEAIEAFTEPGILVLDELQVRGETEFEDRMLTYMLDKRYDAMRDTILIANLTEKAFRESMGYSISDRLVETGGVIECNWKSFRRKESAK